MAALRRWSVSKLETVWAAGVLVVAVAVLLEVGAVQAQDQHAAPYYMPGASPPPYEEATPHQHPLIPAPHTILHGGSGHSAPEHRLLKAVVIGHIICRGCHERRPLPGAQVAIFCWAEDSEAAFYGVTDGDGLYRIRLEGFDYEKYGDDACRAKLVAVPPDSPCKMAAGVTAMGPARLHVKSKAEDEVVLYSKTFSLLAASSGVECHGGESTQRPSTSHGYDYPSPPYHGLSPVPHEYQNHPPPPLILHHTPPPHLHACASPPPRESWPHPPPHLPYHASHIPPPLYHYYTPQQPPLHPPPHHEYSLPPPPYHKQIMPPPPHATDHLYSPPTSYYKPAYPETYPPPLYHSSPSTLTPPHEYESPPPPPDHEYPHTLPPPASPHILVPYPPAGNHETPAVGGTPPPHDLTPAPIPRIYESPPAPQLLPPYSYHPPPVEYNTYNPHQSIQGTPLLNSQIPSFHKSTKTPPPAS